MFAARSLKTIYGGSMVLRYTWYFVELDACFTSVHSLHEDNADLTSLRLAVNMVETNWCLRWPWREVVNDSGVTRWLES